MVSMDPGTARTRIYVYRPGEEFVLEGGIEGSLDLEGMSLGGANLAGCDVAGYVNLRNVRSSGPISLRGLETTGDLVLQGARVTGSVDAQIGRVLGRTILDGSKISGHLAIAGNTVRGVSLRNASIGEYLRICGMVGQYNAGKGTVLCNSSGGAPIFEYVQWGLDCSGTEVGSHLVLGASVMSGDARMRNMRIRGDLLMQDFSCLGNLDLSGTAVEGNLQIGTVLIEREGVLDLRGATIPSVSFDGGLRYKYLNSDRTVEREEFVPGMGLLLAKSASYAVDERTRIPDELWAVLEQYRRA